MTETEWMHEATHLRELLSDTKKELALKEIENLKLKAEIAWLKTQKKEQEKLSSDIPESVL